jgi:hypothetical protein
MLTATAGCSGETTYVDATSGKRYTKLDRFEKNSNKPIVDNESAASEAGPDANSTGTADVTGTSVPTGTVDATGTSVPTGTADVTVTPNGPVKSPEAVPANSTSSPFQPCILASGGATGQTIGAKVFELAPNTKSLAEGFAGGTYKTKICMLKFDVPQRSFREGFPGLPNLFEWFALDARAKLIIPTTGIYRFRMNSDDGSLLYINNELIIDNDGVHGTKSKDATISLNSGEHDFQLRYFQGPAEDIALQLFWTPPGGNEEIVPTSAFRSVSF